MGSGACHSLVAKEHVMPLCANAGANRRNWLENYSEKKNLTTEITLLGERFNKDLVIGVAT